MALIERQSVQNKKIVDLLRQVREGQLDERVKDPIRILLKEEIIKTLCDMGIFVSPFNDFDQEMELILKVCRGRSYREILLYLLKNGPSRFSEICRNVSVSETQVDKCLKKMVAGKLVYKNEGFYDLFPRSFRWIREKRAKLTVLLTIG